MRMKRSSENSGSGQIEKVLELLRQRMKYASDSQRWKNLLETTERERDSFKVEIMRPEVVRQELLTALKTRIKKDTDPKISDKTDNGTGHENLTKVLPVTKDAECETETKCFTSDQSKVPKKVSPKQNVKKNKAKVRFNLSPEYHRNELENVSENMEDTQENLMKDDSQHTEDTVTIIENQNRSREKSMEVNLANISVSAECEFKETDPGNKIEKVLELLRQRMKYASDSQRWKNLLETTERERDSFKVEIMRPEVVRQELLTALKFKMGSCMCNFRVQVEPLEDKKLPVLPSPPTVTQVPILGAHGPHEVNRSATILAESVLTPDQLVDFVNRQLDSMDRRVSRYCVGELIRICERPGRQDQQNVQPPPPNTPCTSIPQDSD